ncbi:RDD family protein [Nocardioides sp.]|uniref:RDD family protein n=1 Tax=Nocardioides sp. TaxID=35761 RepID=UPI002BE3FDFA|nr:RDD family protein [Nocardioides sp.]HVX54049.1 RDD family protein [Nocardioides sp.]
MSTAVSGPTAADPDRRFYAWALDRLFSLVVYAAAGAVAYLTLIRPGHTLAGVAAIVAVAVVVWLIGVLMTGLAGVTPGKSLCGLKVVGIRSGAPAGLGPAFVRQLVVGLGGYPTLGIGDATLAWVATLDGSGLRRSWHDLVAGTIVVDVRRRPEAPIVEEPAPKRVVNLTALRLMPAEPEPASASVGTPVAAPPAVPAPAPPPTTQAAPPPPAAPAAPVPTPAPVVPPSPPAAQAPTAAPPRWRVTFDTGESFVVEGLALVGRGPEPRPDEQVAHVVALHSSDMSLSKTHAQFSVVPDGSLVVMDRGSTNGSTLLRGGVAKPLAARQPATLLPGDRVRFGDREMSVARES